MNVTIRLFYFYLPYNSIKGIPGLSFIKHSYTNLTYLQLERKIIIFDFK